MFETFSPQSLRVIMFAQEAARQQNRYIVDTEHLLVGLTRDEATVAHAALTAKGIAVSEILLHLGTAEPSRRGQAVEVHFSEQVRSIFDLAEEERKLLKDTQVGTEHLLLGLIQLGEGLGIRILRDLGLNLQHMRWSILRLRHGQQENARTPHLDRFSADLTSWLDTQSGAQVVEWKTMIEKMLQYLALYQKHSLLLVGASGTGKTSLIHGLTQYILDSRIFDTFAHYRVVRLSIDTLIAEAPSNEDLHEEIKFIASELRQANDILLVIENIHQLFLAGKKEMEFVITQQLITLLKEPTIYCLATTTPQFFQQLSARGLLNPYFQILWVPEPPDAFCLKVLQHWQKFLEHHHQLEITEEALTAAVQLSRQFEQNKCLPEAALTLLDVAAADKRWQRTLGVFSARKAERKLRRLREKREAASMEGHEQKQELLKQELLQTERLLKKYNEMACKDQTLKLTAGDIAPHVKPTGETQGSM